MVLVLTGILLFCKFEEDNIKIKYFVAPRQLMTMKEMSDLNRGIISRLIK